MGRRLLASVALLCLSSLSALSHSAKQQLSTQTCDERHLAALRNDSSFKPHSFTSRGLSHMKSVFPGGLSLAQLLETACASPGYAVFELGCGSAHNLLDVLHLCPTLQVFGTNFGGYGFRKDEHGFGQIHGEQSELLAAAAHFKVPVACDATGEPILPIVRLAPSVTSAHFLLKSVFPGQTFNLILSRDALNFGKVQAQESHVFIPRLLPALRSGGLIVAHLEYGSDVYFAKSPGYLTSPFHILIRTTLQYEGESVTLVLYALKVSKRAGLHESLWAIALEKCLKKCVLDAVRGEAELPLITLDASATTDRELRYAIAHFENLVARIKRWEEMGEIKVT